MARDLRHGTARYKQNRSISPQYTFARNVIYQYSNAYHFQTNQCGMMGFIPLDRVFQVVFDEYLIFEIQWILLLTNSDTKNF